MSQMRVEHSEHIGVPGTLRGATPKEQPLQQKFGRPDLETNMGEQ